MMTHVISVFLLFCLLRAFGEVGSPDVQTVSSGHAEGSHHGTGCGAGAAWLSAQDGR